MRLPTPFFDVFCLLMGIFILFNQMSGLVAQALGSSIWGVTLAMVAFVMKFVCSREDEEDLS